MRAKVLAFFNNKGGVGKTSMVYHLAWMFVEKGLRIVAVDFDPQCNLTAAFLDEECLEKVLGDSEHQQTLYGCLQPLVKGIGDVVRNPPMTTIDETGALSLVAGDMSLSTFEDQLSEVWPKCMDGDERAFRVTSAFWRILENAANNHDADLVLIDLGPNLGAINRTALIACHYVVIPLGPDLFSLQGLQNLGPVLQQWQNHWKSRLKKSPAPDLSLPPGEVNPIGYMVLRHSIRLDRPVKAYERWIQRIPSTYAKYIQGGAVPEETTVDNDPNCIARIKDYRSLMPLAQEARKPMFLLKPADGALGAHTYAVEDAYREFSIVAKEIAARMHMDLRS